MDNRRRDTSGTQFRMYGDKMSTYYMDFDQSKRSGTLLNTVLKKEEKLGETYFKRQRNIIDVLEDAVKGRRRG